MPMLPPAELLPRSTGLALPLGQHAGPASNSSGHRRCTSAPSLSLDSLTDAALRVETTPCSVLDLNALDDDTSRLLRRTLQQTQAELTALVQAGVLKDARGSGDSSGGAGTTGGHWRMCGSDEAASDGEGPSRRRSGSGDRAAQPGSSGCTQSDGGADPELELELAGLPAREREAALKRAKNREAARRSRERKAERINVLRGEVHQLQGNNFVLLKCIEEVACKALAARGERRKLQEKLAQLQVEPAGPPAGAADPAPGSSPLSLLGVGGGSAVGAGDCTPPAARRAAALEAELLALEAAAPASPTQLLLPRWPDVPAAPAAGADDAGRCVGAPATAPPSHRPTSAELRRELRRAVAGDGAEERVGGAGSWDAAGEARQAGGSGGSGGGGGGGIPAWLGPSQAANQHHLLHPSPAGRRPGMQGHHRRQQQQPRQQQQQQQFPQHRSMPQQAQQRVAAVPAALVHLQQGGCEGPLLRTVSTPGGPPAAGAALPGRSAAGGGAPAWANLATML